MSSSRFDQYRSVQYTDLSPVDSDETSLGVYPCYCPPIAVLVWVHGGGWVQGDRRNTRYIPEFCRRNNILFISVNYPLSSIGHDSLIDIQLMAMRALNEWFLDNEWSDHYVDAFKNIILMSHSSGSHLVSLADKYYGWIDAVSTLILMDCGAYDLKTRFYRAKPPQRRQFQQLLRLDRYPENQHDHLLVSYSPALIDFKESVYPDRTIIILTSIRRGAVYSAERLAKSYLSLGGKVKIVRFDWNHDYFPESIGLDADVNTLILEASHRSSP